MLDMSCYNQIIEVIATRAIQWLYRRQWQMAKGKKNLFFSVPNPKFYNGIMPSIFGRLRFPRFIIRKGRRNSFMNK